MNPSRWYVRAGSLTLGLLLLLACGRATPTPPPDSPTRVPTSTEAAEAATPTLAAAATATTPEATATLAGDETTAATATTVAGAVPTPAVPGATAEPPTLTEDRYENEALGLAWDVPGEGWRLRAVPESDQPMMQGLVSLQAPDGTFFVLTALPFADAGLGMQGAVMAKNPDVFFEQALQNLGLEGSTSERVEVGGAPAVRLEMAPGQVLYMIVRPVAAFSLFTQLPAGTSNEVVEQALAGLRFFEPVGQAVAEALPTPLPDPKSPEEQREGIIGQVEAMRELEAKEAVPFTFLTPTELRERLEKSLAEENDPEELVAEDRLLKLLGLIPADTDLTTLLLDLYSSQVAGFYDPEENEFYLISEAQQGMLGATERVTFAHEMVHALQDQYWDLEPLTDEARLNDDEAAAARAVIEGDAQVITGLYVIGSLSSEDIGAVVAGGSELDRKTLEQTPRFLQESLTFPYVAGEVFVQSWRKMGGVEAINGLYRAMPRSTEQILHPERYPDDVPEAVTLPDLAGALGAGWTEYERNVWGEFSLRQMLAEHLTLDQALRAAEGWGGDSYAFLSDGDGHDLVVFAFAWDEPTEAAEFEKVASLWLEEEGFNAAGGVWQAAADGRAARLGKVGVRSLLAITNQAESLERVWQVLEQAGG
jgi:hypothetical protein